MSEKAKSCYKRLKQTLEEQGADTFAMGPPVASLAADRHAYRDSPLQIVLPERDCAERQFDGVFYVGLKDTAFRRLGSLKIDDLEIPVPSREDTVLVLLKGMDAMTAYRICRNNGIDKDYLLSRIMEEDNPELYSMAYFGLLHLPKLRSVVEAVRPKASPFWIDLANGTKRESREFKMAKSYDGVSAPIEHVLNKALERAEDMHRQKHKLPRFEGLEQELEEDVEELEYDY